MQPTATEGKTRRIDVASTMADRYRMDSDATRTYSTASRARLGRGKRRLVLVLALGLSILASCGDSASEPRTEGTSTDPESLGSCPDQIDGPPAVSNLADELADPAGNWFSVDGIEAESLPEQDASELEGVPATLTGAELIRGDQELLAGEGTLEVSVLPLVVERIQSESENAEEFVVNVTPLRGDRTPGLLRIVSLREDGSAVFVGVCAVRTGTRFGQFLDERGGSLEGQPAEIFRAALTDPEGPEFAALADWFGGEEAPSTTLAWIDRPPGKRQIDPGETPAEFLATLRPVVVHLTIPESWLSGELNTITPDQPQLCLRTDVAYDQCVTLQTGGDLARDLQVHLAEGNDTVELVYTEGSVFDSEVTVIGEIPTSAPDVSYIAARVEGTPQSPSLVVE